MVDDSGQLVLAPRIAAVAAAHWVDHVCRVHTVGEWRAMFREYQRCAPDGLLLGPWLGDVDERDRDNDLEGEEGVVRIDGAWLQPDDAPWSSGDDWLYDGGDGSDWTPQPQIVTDIWLPLEIAERFGHPDHGFGMDYQNAEYVLDPADLPAITAAFNDAGILVVDDQELLEPALWHMQLPDSHAARSLVHQVVDPYGNSVDPLHGSPPANASGARARRARHSRRQRD